VIPATVDVLTHVQGAKSPYMLLTNGGGMTEQDKAASLSQVLGVTIPKHHLQVAHTPMLELVSKYQNDLVMVVGKDHIKTIAEQYGFRKVVTVDDVHMHHPGVFPDYPSPNTPAGDFPDEPIKVILVFMDPMEWHRDLQVCVDVLTSNGQIAQRNAPGSEQEVDIFLSCPDIEYVTEFPIPRFGAGVFGSLLGSIYQTIHKAPLRHTYYGKPHASTYGYAERALHSQALDGGFDSIHKFYMIGDNPESDIMGANGAGWASILVRTGMYQDGMSLTPDRQPTVIVDSVKEAYDYILEQESK